MCVKTFADRTFAIVDVETTGGSPVYDRVIEIGVILVENGRIVDSFQSLVNPGRPLPPFITSITGITPEDVVHAPLFDEIAFKVRELLAGAVFVAHNARFDYSFIKNEFKRIDSPYQAKTLCTVRLSRKLFPNSKRHDLSSLIERHGLTCPSRHRAYDDAHVLWQFIATMRERDAERVDAIVDELLGAHTLSQFLAHDAVSTLPDAPGVYIFYGPQGETLYVGKSVNVKTRVMSHFSGDHANQGELAMCQQVASIECRRTEGELGALLLELELIKSLYPLYNKVSRKKRKLVVARLDDGGEYHSATLELIDRIEPEETGTMLGVFKSKSSAKDALYAACEEHGLCPRLCGLESGSGPCFSHQLGKCSGACVGKVKATDYNELFLKAFEERRVRAWPYKGPVRIDERGESGCDSFLVDRWMLVGTAKEDANGDVEERSVAPEFDYDSYKVLSRFILDRRNKRKISALTSGKLETLCDEPSIL